MKRPVVGAFLVVCLAATAQGPGTRTEGPALARHVLDMAGISKGLCSIIGCGDGAMARAVADSSEFIVHVIDPCGYAIADLEDAADKDGVYGWRLVAEAAALSRLPYADNLVDVLAAVELSDTALAELPASEVLRVLRPKGKAVIGGPAATGLTADVLKKWWEGVGSGAGKIVKDDMGVWVLMTKPRPEGADDWPHWEHGPDNNPVSTDTIIRAPYMTQWLGLPYYIAMPAITTVSDGRTFIAMGHIAHHEREEPWLNTLLARNGYNGIELWQRKLPDGYMVHRSAFIATPDVFYMIDVDGNGCVMLDPETGEEKGEIRIPEAAGEWKWIALEDGVLFVLSGKQKDPAETTVVRSTFSHWSWGELSKGYYQERVPWGFGETLTAYDLKKGKLLWVHREDKAMDSRGMVIGGGKVFFYGPDSRIGCLSAASGSVAWANDDPKIRELVEQPGQGLGSTPGFKSTCFVLYTPEALCYAAQTRMNVVALSTRDGRLLWHRAKTTNNPNMLSVDGRLVVGIGAEGSTQMVDPLTGSTIEDLGFWKRSCARLTATPDSFFCRGWPEGITRYDRAMKKFLFNGAFRPSCNDGVIAANGLLYAGPWLCDCNLSLMGGIALCTARDFDFRSRVDDARRLQIAEADPARVAPLETTPEDWADYRANHAHSASTNVSVGEYASYVWRYAPPRAYQPSAATAAGGLVFVCGDDGKVRAIDAATGALKWTYRTAGPIRRPPVIWSGRAYVGSGDGHVYALEATTGRLLWRFRAAPTERRTMVYGALCSTWPVNTGVLVRDGVAYFGAGIIDYDGTYLYALDAVTGKVKWQNDTSGHLDPELRKGVSVQGGLVAAGGRLWMAGGNVISPAAYDLATGRYVGDSPGNGSPRSNRGEEIGLFNDHCLILGGRLLYSASENVVDPGTFDLIPLRDDGVEGATPLHEGKIPPAWDNEIVVAVKGRRGPLVACSVKDVEAYVAARDPKRAPRPLWVANMPKGSDVVSVALAKNAALAVCEIPGQRSLASRWTVCALDLSSGDTLWRFELPSAALAGGLLVDRDGRVIISLADGSLVCVGGEGALEAYIAPILESAKKNPNEKATAIRALTETLKVVQGGGARELVISRIEELGGVFNEEARKTGCLIHWRLLGPVPWDTLDNPMDKAFVGEPNVDVSKACQAGDRSLTWRPFATEHPGGFVDLARLYGTDENLAMYAYAEVTLPKAQELLLKIGTNDGYKCWFNGQEAGRFDGGRGYKEDQDTLSVTGRQGVNAILLKVTQLGGAWGFGVRIANPDGTPLDLTTQR